MTLTMAVLGGWRGVGRLGRSGEIHTIKEKSKKKCKNRTHKAGYLYFVPRSENCLGKAYLLVS